MRGTTSIIRRRRIRGGFRRFGETSLGLRMADLFSVRISTTAEEDFLLHAVPGIPAGAGDNAGDAGTLAAVTVGVQNTPGVNRFIHSHQPISEAEIAHQTRRDYLAILRVNRDQIPFACNSVVSVLERNAIGSAELRHLDAMSVGTRNLPNRDCYCLSLGDLNRLLRQRVG